MISKNNNTKVLWQRRWVMLEEDSLPQKLRRAASAQEVYVYGQNNFFSEKKRTFYLVRAPEIEQWCEGSWDGTLPHVSTPSVRGYS